MSSAGGNSACTFRRFSAVGGTATIGVRQRSGLTLRSSGPPTAWAGSRPGGYCPSAVPNHWGPLNSNVRPLNTLSPRLQHAFGHIAFKHLQPSASNVGPSRRLGCSEQAPKQWERTSEKKAKVLRSGHARVFWAFGYARVFKTSRTIQNVMVGQGQSGSQTRETEVFKRSETNL